MDKPPFDFGRAAFYLVAAVILAHVVLVGMVASVCLWHARALIEVPANECVPPGQLMEVLAGALAAALAFAGGNRRR